MHLYMLLYIYMGSCHEILVLNHWVYLQCTNGFGVQLVCLLTFATRITSLTSFANE